MSKVFKAKLALQGLKARQARQALRAFKESRALKAKLDQRDLRAFRESKEFREFKVKLDRKARLAQRGLLVLTALSLDLLVLRAKLDQQDQ